MNTLDWIVLGIVSGVLAVIGLVWVVLTVIGRRARGRASRALRNAMLDRVEELRSAPFTTAEEQERWLSDFEQIRSLAVDLGMIESPDADSISDSHPDYDKLAELEAQADAAVDRAVKSIREAEAAGTLSPDPRSDAEIKESLREMFEEDLRADAEWSDDLNDDDT